MTRRQRRRLFAVAAVAVAAVATLVMAVQGAGSYSVTARFADAGGLVEGGVVEVGGARVGEVAAMRLSHDGQAEVEMSIDDKEWRPLHTGTRATVRAVGQAGVANRFVELRPGPRDAQEIPDGGVLPSDRTRPIVDIDVILNSFDRPTRQRLQRILRNTAKASTGATPRDWNETLRYLDPAVSQGNELASELTRDEVAVERLLVTGARTAAALSSRRGDLEQAIGHSADVLGRVAGERAALSETLRRAPGVLSQASGTLRRTRDALRVVRPALREARPAAAPLEGLLRELDPAARRATPVLGDLHSLVPSLRATLRGLPPVDRTGTRALRSTAATVKRAQPIFAGLRPYAPDLVAGLFNSAGATNSGGYDANGHMIRVAVHEPGNSGLLAPLLDLDVPGLRETREGVTERCPGAAVEPARDRSNPWIPDPSLCNPGDSP